MKPVEIPYTRSDHFTKEKMFTTPDKIQRIPRKLKKKRNKQNRGQ